MHAQLAGPNPWHPGSVGTPQARLPGTLCLWLTSSMPAFARRRTTTNKWTDLAEMPVEPRMNTSE